MLGTILSATHVGSNVDLQNNTKKWVLLLSPLFRSEKNRGTETLIDVPAEGHRIRK